MPSGGKATRQRLIASYRTSADANPTNEQYRLSMSPFRDQFLTVALLTT